MLATVLAAFIQVGLKEWIFANVKDICEPGQLLQLTCPHNQIFFTASAGHSSLFHLGVAFADAYVWSSTIRPSTNDQQ